MSDATRWGALGEPNGQVHMTAYDNAYYNRQVEGALRSARRVVPIVARALKPKSIADFGCGCGAWLRAWSEVGVNEFHGFDGDYVQRSSLLVSEDHFSAVDLSKPQRSLRRFEFAQSLEVAEHLPREASDILVTTLVAAAPVVLFSAAVRGQGGESHVNEQPMEFWRAQFRAHDFLPFDFLRPLIASDESVEPWYRYNSLLYVHRAHVHALAESVRSTAIADGTSINEGGSLRWRARRAVVSLLPRSVVNKIARTLAARTERRAPNAP